MPTSRFPLAALAPLTIVAAALCMARPAEAWIFPEHAEITRLDLDHELTPEAREALEALLSAARGTTGAALPLCEELTIPFARVAEHAPLCIPFSVLPALAGDHSVNTAELRLSLFSRTE